MSNTSNMKAPRITDSSLRDGSHPMRHQFTKAQVRAVARALDEAGVPVRDRDGLAGDARPAFIGHRPQNGSRCGLAIRQSPQQQHHSKHTPANRSSLCLQHLSPLFIPPGKPWKGSEVCFSSRF